MDIKLMKKCEFVFSRKKKKILGYIKKLYIHGMEIYADEQDNKKDFMQNNPANVIIILKHIEKEGWITAGKYKWVRNAKKELERLLNDEYKYLLSQFELMDEQYKKED